MKVVVIGVFKDFYEGDRFNILKFFEVVKYYKDLMVYVNKKFIDDVKEYVVFLLVIGGIC